MPTKPMRSCRYPGCPHLTHDKTGYCDPHLKLTQRQYDAERGTANQRGYNYRWQQRSKLYLAEHPLCYYCQARQPPVVKAANLVDHYIPHRGDYDLFWDETNWRSSCDDCHKIKTAAEDGAFGNPTNKSTSEW